MEEASALISTIDSIRGSIIWVAFIDNDDSTIRVRLRSRFVEINKVAEKYRGGGHAQASGATLNHRKEIKSILNAKDIISIIIALLLNIIFLNHILSILQLFLIM